MFDNLIFSFWQFLIAVDQVGNTLLGGWADETISSRSYRLSNRRKRWAVARKMIDFIFGLFGQKNHCYEAWIDERKRYQSPPEERL